MQMQVYHMGSDHQEPFEAFVQQLYSSQMPHLASDLLEKGVSPGELVKAVRKAVRVAKLAEEPVRKHFQFVYTQSKNGLINDCKLSGFGLGLVLINIEPSTKKLARWQVNLLQNQSY